VEGAWRGFNGVAEPRLRKESAVTAMLGTEGMVETWRGEVVVEELA